MRFNEFIEKVEEVLERYDSITFSYPNCDNGASFGMIEKSNMDGILMAGEYHYLGDGDVAMSEIKLYKEISDAFEYIWKMRGFKNELGACINYNFRFDMVDGLYVQNCYYVL